MSVPLSTKRERVFPKYWQAGAVKNRGNVSCELRECQRDKSKTKWHIRKGRWIEIASTFGSLGRRMVKEENEKGPKGRDEWLGRSTGVVVGVAQGGIAALAVISPNSIFNARLPLPAPLFSFFP
jgi:hypothetical protein